MANHIGNDVNLAGMFGLDMAPDADIGHVDVSSAVCPKCRGRGNFISHAGRIVGACFACNGTGAARSAGIALQAGDCVKCAGTGEWRPGRPCFACNGTGKERVAAAAAAIDISAIATAFAAAYEHGIKRPKLRLDEFQFSRAPDTGRNAGAVYVKHAKTDAYLGKVTDGQFHASRECDDPTRARVIEVSADPHASAKAYGQRTGQCSCCGRELTNGESIDLGIGPICRERFGW